MSNMNFLIADVIQFASGKRITFSQGDATKIKSKQFLEFGCRTMCNKPEDIFQKQDHVI